MGCQPQLSMEFLRMIRETAFVDESRTPLRFVPAAHQATVAALIDAVMEGQPFVALTGPPGIGKTTVASAIRDELAAQSVRVLEVHRIEDAGISLGNITSQILSKSDAELHVDDIEKLFDVMTMRKVLDERFALIIEDAECLQADAIGYLRLLALLAKDTMPRIVCVGSSEFWDTDHAVYSNLKELITAHWELPRLSPDEARDFIEQATASRCSATETGFAPGGIEALVMHGDGLCGRIVSLMSLSRSLQVVKHERCLTTNLVDEAAAKLDAGLATTFEAAHQRPHPEILAESDVSTSSADRRIVARRLPWMSRVAGVVVVLLVIAVPASRQASLSVAETDPRPTAVEQPAAAAAYDHIATEVASVASPAAAPETTPPTVPAAAAASPAAAPEITPPTGPAADVAPPAAAPETTPPTVPAAAVAAPAAAPEITPPTVPAAAVAPPAAAPETTPPTVPAAAAASPAAAPEITPPTVPAAAVASPAAAPETTPPTVPAAAVAPPAAAPETTPPTVPAAAVASPAAAPE